MNPIETLIATPRPKPGGAAPERTAERAPTGEEEGASEFASLVDQGRTSDRSAAAEGAPARSTPDAAKEGAKGGAPVPETGPPDTGGAGDIAAVQPAGDAAKALRIGSREPVADGGVRQVPLAPKAPGGFGNVTRPADAAPGQSAPSALFAKGGAATAMRAPSAGTPPAARADAGVETARPATAAAPQEPTGSLVEKAGPAPGGLKEGARAAPAPVPVPSTTDQQAQSALQQPRADGAAVRRAEASGLLNGTALTAGPGPSSAAPLVTLPGGAAPAGATPQGQQTAQTVAPGLLRSYAANRAMSADAAPRTGRTTEATLPEIDGADTAPPRPAPKVALPGEPTLTLPPSVADSARGNAEAALRLAADGAFTTYTAQPQATGQPAPAPAPIAMPPGLAERSVLPQVVQAVQSTNPPGVVDLTLDPPELGRIEIVLELGDKGIRATLVAERPWTADLLRRHADLLSQQFQDAGFSDVDLNFGDPRDSGGRELASMFDTLADPEPAAAAPAPTPGTAPRSQRAADPSGHLDIRR